MTGELVQVFNKHAAHMSFHFFVVLSSTRWRFLTSPPCPHRYQLGLSSAYYTVRAPVAIPDITVSSVSMLNKHSQGGRGILFWSLLAGLVLNMFCKVV